MFNSNIQKSINSVTGQNPLFFDVLSIPSNPEDIFTILSPIGHGAFATVYKAIHNESKKLYAIKMVYYFKDENSIINNIHHIENINFCYKTAQEETSLMRLVNKSNYILKYYGSYFSRKSNSLWIIFEYCEFGSTVDLMLAMDRTYNEIELATIIKMVLQALIILHSKKLIHRDIKGANILLSSNGYAKLGDFGVGIEIINNEMRNSKKGSPYWMSPQVVLKKNYDMKTDIWSLGITCLELINGEPPYSEIKPKKVMELIGKMKPDFNKFFKNNIVYSEEFKNFIKLCLQVEPEKRPTALELFNHPFIKKNAKSNIYLSKLINDHKKELEDFRKEVEEFEKEIKYKKNNKNNEKEMIDISKENYNDKNKSDWGSFKSSDINFYKNDNSYVSYKNNDVSSIMSDFIKNENNNSLSFYQKKFDTMIKIKKFPTEKNKTIISDTLFNGSISLTKKKQYNDLFEYSSSNVVSNFNNYIDIVNQSSNTKKEKGKFSESFPSLINNTKSLKCRVINFKAPINKKPKFEKLNNFTTVINDENINKSNVIENNDFYYENKKNFYQRNNFLECLNKDFINDNQNNINKNNLIKINIINGDVRINTNFSNTLNTCTNTKNNSINIPKKKFVHSNTSIINHYTDSNFQIFNKNTNNFYNKNTIKYKLLSTSPQFFNKTKKNSRNFSINIENLKTGNNNKSEDKEINDNTIKELHFEYDVKKEKSENIDDSDDDGEMNVANDVELEQTNDEKINIEENKDDNKNNNKNNNYNDFILDQCFCDDDKNKNILTESIPDSVGFFPIIHDNTKYLSNTHQKYFNATK